MKNIKGIALIILSVVLAISFVIFNLNNKNNNRYEKEVVGKIMETPVYSYTAATNYAIKTKNKNKVPFVAPKEKENYANKIKIVNMSKKQLKMLGITSKELEKKLKIYANENGYAEVDKAYYGKEITFNSNDKTISALFYFRYNHQDYKFYVVRYVKKNIFEPF